MLQFIVFADAKVSCRFNRIDVGNSVRGGYGAGTQQTVATVCSAFFISVTANQLYRELQFLHSCISDAWFWQ